MKKINDNLQYNNSQFHARILPFYRDSKTKTGKAVINLLTSVRPSNRIEQLGSHLKDFDKI